MPPSSPTGTPSFPGEGSARLSPWLEELRSGNPRAVDELVPLLYAELRGMARRRLRLEWRRHTLSTTALVHEVYLKLHRQRRIAAEDRAAFLTVAGNTMRQILVEHARARKRLKRGRGAAPLPLDAARDQPLFLDDAEVEELLALDAALERLEHLDPRAAEVVKHRFFAGLTLDETAEVLGVSKKTVQRSWTTARAWLRKEVAGAGGTPAGGTPAGGTPAGASPAETP